MMNETIAKVIMVGTFFISVAAIGAGIYFSAGVTTWRRDICENYGSTYYGEARACLTPAGVLVVPKEFLR